jgi:hypothetical protein
LLDLDAIYQLPIIALIYIGCLILAMIGTIVFMCRAIYRMVKPLEERNKNVKT